MGAAGWEIKAEGLAISKEILPSIALFYLIKYLIDLFQLCNRGFYFTILPKIPASSLRAFPVKFIIRYIKCQLILISSALALLQSDRGLPNSFCREGVNRSV